ncbi:hypothetical protein V8D89_006891 [Ganoderma adspersum]
MQASFRYILAVVAVVATAFTVAQATPVPAPVERREAWGFGDAGHTVYHHTIPYRCRHPHVPAPRSRCERCADAGAWARMLGGFFWGASGLLCCAFGLGPVCSTSCLLYAFVTPISAVIISHVLAFGPWAEAAGSLTASEGGMSCTTLLRSLCELRPSGMCHRRATEASARSSYPRAGLDAPAWNKGGRTTLNGAEWANRVGNHSMMQHPSTRYWAPCDDCDPRGTAIREGRTRRPSGQSC